MGECKSLKTGDRCIPGCTNNVIIAPTGFDLLCYAKGDFDGLDSSLSCEAPAKTVPATTGPATEAPATTVPATTGPATEGTTPTPTSSPTWKKIINPSLFSSTSVFSDIIDPNVSGSLSSFHTNTKLLQKVLVILIIFVTCI